jgi:hypothetical protein
MGDLEKTCLARTNRGNGKTTNCWRNQIDLLRSRGLFGITRRIGIGIRVHMEEIAPVFTTVITSIFLFLGPMVAPMGDFVRFGLEESE